MLCEERQMQCAEKSRRVAQYTPGASIAKKLRGLFTAHKNLGPFDAALINNPVQWRRPWFVVDFYSG